MTHYQTVAIHMREFYSLGKVEILIPPTEKAFFWKVVFIMDTIRVDTFTKMGMVTMMRVIPLEQMPLQV